MINLYWDSKKEGLSTLPDDVRDVMEYRISSSIPSILGKDGVEKVLEINLNEEELRLLQNSADELKKLA